MEDAEAGDTVFSQAEPLNGKQTDGRNIYFPKDFGDLYSTGKFLLQN